MTLSDQAAAPLSDADGVAVRRRHPGAAAAASAALLVASLVLAIAGGVVGVVYTQGQTLGSLDGFDYALPALGFAVPYSLGRLVPLAVGVFLSFWLLLPLRPEQRLGGAIARIVAAALIGLLLAVAIDAVRMLAIDAPVAPADGDNRYYILILGTLAHNAWTLFADTVGLVLAAGLAMWGGLRPRPAVF